MRAACRPYGWGGCTSSARLTWRWSGAGGSGWLCLGRARRAEERAAALQQWLGAASHRARAGPRAAGPELGPERQANSEPELPFRPEAAQADATCAVCGRTLKT